MKSATLAILLTLPLSPARADAPPVRIMVPHDDLDLDRQSGAETVLWRLRAAIGHACGARSIRDPAVEGTYRACLRRGMDDAVTRLDAPLVRALYDRPFVREAMGE
jgi:UrcA family protein